ncbi:imidazolonepropionase [Asaia lannensis]|uniref:Imidazolonepropionase n=1 Tax=Asaia lannensis NBRC 102526 TaxID=1307926 RepID=A0ABT1CC60_9PROT|nr:imidazolonepropionase [Asaia lannensis]MCO6158455.1 imidazolonepropionase [Asaia lannensis NBRC 102526]GBR01188.1 imidazolonepropionase [Asaia lannensis NBRC 102526]
MWDRLWINAHLATLAPHVDHHDIETESGLLRDGAIAVEQGRIAWIGSRCDLPGAPETLSNEVIDCRGAWITPGLIDPHTHLVYAGDRSEEFSERLCGVSYQEIARRGGGILSTVRATRAASEDELFALSEKRAKRLMANGVTTLEIKSGYGLTLEDELKQLRVARRLGSELRLRVHVSFLGAHALPPEFVGRREAYLGHLCTDLLPQIAAGGLADSVDGFCEGIAFQPHEIERLFITARDLGFTLRLHADQLSDLGGASLAARLGALSADHVEYAHEEGIRAMAAQGTVAVLLPGAFYFVREDKLPPVEAFRAHGVRMALATDCNPGTSPLLSPTAVMNMACTLFRLTPREALDGHTRHAAAALGLSATCGMLAPGMAADMALWDITAPHELAYWIGGVMPVGRVFAGVPDQVL